MTLPLASLLFLSRLLPALVVVRRLARLCLCLFRLLAVVALPRSLLLASLPRSLLLVVARCPLAPLLLPVVAPCPLAPRLLLSPPALPLAVVTVAAVTHALPTSTANTPLLT